MALVKITPAPAPPAPKRDPKHEVSRTVHINKMPVDIDYMYDYDPAAPEASQKRKEAAFDAALAKKYPGGLISSRGNRFHYTLV